MRHSLAGIVGTLLAIASSLSAAADGDVVRGRESYHAYGCWQCHGTTGAGGGWQGPKIAPTPIPFAAFVLQLRTPRGNMPHYPQQLLSDRDVADMYAFLSSIPSGRTADQIEIL